MRDLKLSQSTGCCVSVFFFQAEDGIRDLTVTGVQTCALPILKDMGAHLQEAGTPERGKVFLAKAHELEKRSKTFHDVVLQHESLSGDNLGQDDEIGRASCRERV